jgi:hypothetical protein
VPLGASGAASAPGLAAGPNQPRSEAAVAPIAIVVDATAALIASASLRGGGGVVDIGSSRTARDAHAG